MPEKILIVEDNEKNRILIRDILQYYGYEVMEAGDGGEGVKMARENMPDLILMDIQLPVMDGFAAAEMLKNSPETKDIKIIALTSFALKGDMKKIMAAGFDDYISKPINTRALPEIIKKHFGKASYISEGGHEKK